jgi:hypothetical protein
LLHSKSFVKEAFSEVLQNNVVGDFSCNERPQNIFLVVLVSQVEEKF